MKWKTSDRHLGKAKLSAPSEMGFIILEILYNGIQNISKFCDCVIQIKPLNIFLKYDIKPLCAGWRERMVLHPAELGSD